MKPKHTEKSQTKETLFSNTMILKLNFKRMSVTKNNSDVLKKSLKKIDKNNKDIRVIKYIIKGNVFRQNEL